jgi:hypothetical protein
MRQLARRRDKRTSAASAQLFYAPALGQPAAGDRAVAARAACHRHGFAPERPSALCPRTGKGRPPAPVQGRAGARAEKLALALRAGRATALRPTLPADERARLLALRRHVAGRGAVARLLAAIGGLGRERLAALWTRLGLRLRMLALRRPVARARAVATRRRPAIGPKRLAAVVARLLRTPRVCSCHRPMIEQNLTFC